MHTKTIVGSAIGLHAGPPRSSPAEAAGAKAAVPADCSFTAASRWYAGSALMIMTLGPGNGAQVTNVGPSEDEQAMKTIAQLSSRTPHHRRRCP